MAAITQSRHALFGRRYGSFAGKLTLTWTSKGEPQLFTAANWSGVTWVFQATLRVATTGTAYARAWDRTSSVVVTGSEISTTATAKTRVRSGALTVGAGTGELVDAHEYESQFAVSVGGSAETWGGRLIG